MSWIRFPGLRITNQVLVFSSLATTTGDQAALLQLLPCVTQRSRGNAHHLFNVRISDTKLASATSLALFHQIDVEVLLSWSHLLPLARADDEGMDAEKRFNHYPSMYDLPESAKLASLIANIATLIGTSCNQLSPNPNRRSDFPDEPHS
jgi:hypothetical protein